MFRPLSVYRPPWPRWSPPGLAACGGSSSAAGGAPVSVRLGYFPNVTHAPAIVGVQEGIFAKHLGATQARDVKTFNAGPEAVEALSRAPSTPRTSGPNPAINAYSKSNGQAVTHHRRRRRPAARRSS